MSCPAPASASEVFCRAAKCNRWVARLLIFAAVIVTIIMAKAGAEFVHNASPAAGSAERIVGFIASFLAQLLLQLTLFCLARRRCSAAHHARVKANNLKALELLAASATDESTKKDLLARAADLVAGKPGCCK